MRRRRKRGTRSRHRGLSRIDVTPALRKEYDKSKWPRWYLLFRDFGEYDESLPFLVPNLGAESP